jgi:hypothetical protein
MSMKLDELLKDESIPDDENEYRNWEERVHKFLMDNIHLRKAYSEAEVYSAMATKYRYPPPTPDNIKSALMELVKIGMVLTKSRGHINYYWIE